MITTEKRAPWSWQDPLTFPHVLFYVLGLVTGAMLTGVAWGLLT